jgi:hypothetical protein
MFWRPQLLTLIYRKERQVFGAIAEAGSVEAAIGQKA